MEEDFKEKIMWWLISLLMFLGVGYILIQSSWISADYLSFEGLLSFVVIGVFFQKVVFSIVLFFVFGIILKILQAILLSKFVKNKIHSDGYIGFIKLFGFAWWVLYGIVILSIFVDNFGSIVTSLGLIGFGLTLALQKPILNFVGWLTINFKLIYTIGDRIEINGVRGDVIEIAVMNTVIDSVGTGNASEFKTITFPNELVLSNNVVNFTRESNYILDKLVITITYESDYHKALTIFESIIIREIKENKKNYQKHIKMKSKEIEDLIKESTKLLSSRLKKKDSKKIEREIEDNKIKLEEHQKKMDVLDKELIPSVRIELLDSAIALEGFYLVPYNAVKKTRTKINLDFMDKIAKTKGIEIAYPHMEIVYHGDKLDLPKK